MTSQSITRSWVWGFGFALGLAINGAQPSPVYAQPFDPAIVAEITSARAAADAALARGDYRGAEVAFSRALMHVRTLVPDGHQDIAIGVNIVAVMVLAQGEFARAKPLFIDVLMRFDRLGLFDAPIAFTTRDNLIQTLLELGQLRQALTLARGNLEGRKRLMPHDAAAIGSSVNTLMMVFIEQGAYEEAEQVYAQAAGLVPSDVRETEIVRGALLSNLALALLGQEKLSQAERINRDAMVLRRRHLPVGHPDTATSLNNLASILMAQGKNNEALALQREVLDVMVRTLGPNHPKSITTLTNIGILEERLGQKDRAIATATQVVALRRAQKPINHADLAKALNNLATPLVGSVKNAQAIELLEEARSLAGISVPSGHPDILNYTLNLAIAVHESDKSARSIDLLREAVAGWARQPQQWHSQKAHSRTILARALVDAGQRDEAYSLQRTVGADLQTTFGTRAGIDLESQREFRKWQWVFRGQMQLGWFAAHPDMRVDLADFKPYRH